MNRLKLLTMLDYAMLAYSDTPTCNKLKKLVFINCEDNGVQYYVGRKNNTIVIAFRGTDSFRDLLTDAEFWKMSIPYGNTNSDIKVHSGFIKAYKHPCVRDAIHTFITDEIDTVYITGHSYGAALSLLCAIDLEYNFPKKYYEVALFGCPCVGNRAFVSSYNKRLIKTLRVENGNDMVSKIPFRFMGFSHAGIRIHIGTPRIIGVFSLGQHAVQQYYEKLWKA